MTWFLRRYQRFLASTVLGLWAFAVLVGIANACGWDGVAAVPHRSTLAVHGVTQSSDGKTAPAHEHVCSNDLALLGALVPVQDPPGSHPFVLVAHHHLGFPLMSASALRCARTGLLPPGVPLSLRTVRLAL